LCYNSSLEGLVLYYDDDDDGGGGDDEAQFWSVFNTLIWK
jgi:hypothetical protein